MRLTARKREVKEEWSAYQPGLYLIHPKSILNPD